MAPMTDANGTTDHRIGRLRLMFSHWPIAVMALAMLAGLGILLAGPWWLWLLVPLGIALQFLNEYAMHRFLFHLPPPRAQWRFDLLYQAHYGHHDFPIVPGLFFVPWWVALPMLATHYLVVSLLGGLIVPDLGWQIGAAIVLLGGVGTFMAYEWFHMTAHLPVPKTRPERHVTSLHNQHHFRDFRRWFHVSPGGEVIDRALGTAIDREALRHAQRTEFITTLGLSPDDPRLMAARARFGPRHGITPDQIARAARQG